MKELLISNCEKNHVLKGLTNFVRIDGRAFHEFRELKISFGRDWGCCHVSLGETRILAQVSCEIQQPKVSRPNEGLLNINVELSPMGAPNFEAGRQSHLSVHLNRTLEKCIKDSRAVDLESLCIKANEKVWALRVDLNVLNHEGNLIDCASVAALASLSHFKRPDVTSDGETIIIHPHEKKDPISTTIQHYPVCVSYAIFSPDAIYIADPTLLEEEAADAHLTLAINAYREICSIHMGGSSSANTTLIVECSSRAASRAINVVQSIRNAIKEDEENRKQGKELFFENIINHCKDVNLLRKQLSLCLHKWNVTERKKRRNNEQNETSNEPTGKISKIGEGSAELITEAEVQDFRDSSDDDIQVVQTTSNIPENIEIVNSDGSEEEQVIVLSAENDTIARKAKSRKKKNKRRN